MKKNTLLVWAVLFSAPLFAQGENKNLIKNGDFEDTGYVSFVYEDNVKCCPDLVTGWDADKQRGEDGFKDKDFNNKGLSKFYVRGEIVTDSLADTGGQQCMRVQRYEWSGSEQGYSQGIDGGIQQTLEVLPDASYDFSFLYRLSNRLNNGQAVNAFWEIYEGDENAVDTKVTRKSLYNEMNNKWYSKAYSFKTKATTTRVRIKLGIVGGYVQTWGGNMGMFADYDNVNLVQNATSSIMDLNKNQEASLVAIAEGNNVVLSGVDTAEEVEVYSMVGTLILSLPAEETMRFTLPDQGIYIIRNGVNRKSVRIIIR